jgi:hypothetical protein
MNTFLHISEIIVFGSIAIVILFKIAQFIFEVFKAIKDGTKEGLEELYEQNGVNSFKELKNKKKNEKKNSI